MSAKSNIVDFTQGSVTGKLLKFATPLFLSSMLQIVYNMVDMIIVGRKLGKVGLSAFYYDGRNNPPHLEQWIGFFLRIMALNAEKIYEMAQKATEKAGTNPLLDGLSKKDKKMLKFVLENRLDFIKTKNLAEVFMVTPRSVSKWCREWRERDIDREL